jgi:hypothetical protein
VKLADMLRPFFKDRNAPNRYGSRVKE